MPTGKQNRRSRGQYVNAVNSIGEERYITPCIYQNQVRLRVSTVVPGLRDGMNTKCISILVQYAEWSQQYPNDTNRRFLSLMNKKSMLYHGV
jgi:hypothetical protein